MHRKFTSIIISTLVCISLVGCGKTSNTPSVENKTEQTKEDIANSKNIEFKTKTINGKDIDNSVFKNNKLTMINIWATYCGPCINEMEDLEKLYLEIKKENVNLIGIVIDTSNNKENQALAKKISDKKGVTFANIIPDEKLINNLLTSVQAVPTTIFVDNKGAIVGKPILGSNSKENYKKAIEERLTSLK